MYRDVALTLDEHDGAVGAILIAEALISGCELAAKKLAQPQSEPWLAVGDAQFFSEIWRHLDRASRDLGKRGTNVATYRDLRPHAKQSVISQAKNGAPVIDTDALDHARRALEALKLAIPGADWVAIEKRTAGLVNEPTIKRRNYTFIGAVVGAFVLASVAWTSAIAPPKHKPDVRVEMRNELADIAQERKLKIEGLRTSLGDKCLPNLAHQYVESLALDGRADDARAFGDEYVERCGDDQVVTNWAHAPKIRARSQQSSRRHSH